MPECMGRYSVEQGTIRGMVSRRNPAELREKRDDRGEQESEEILADSERLRAIVVRIQGNDESAKRQLYQVFNRGIRFQLVRHLGTTDIEDKVHDTFLIVLQAIMREDLRKPERLLGYIRTVVRRQIANYIERAVVRRREHSNCIDADSREDSRNPEESYLRHEQQILMRQVLSELNARDREILIRFYIDEMPQEVICAEMGLTLNQFRLMKSRAKARFSEMGRRHLRPKLLTRFHTAAG